MSFSKCTYVGVLCFNLTSLPFPNMGIFVSLGLWNFIYINFFFTSWLWKISYWGGPSNICSSHYSLLSCVWKPSEARRMNFWTIIFPTKEIIISASLVHIKYLLFTSCLLRSMRERWASTRFLPERGLQRADLDPLKPGRWKNILTCGQCCSEVYPF